MKIISGKTKRRRRSIFLWIAILAFAIYVVAAIISQQIQIGQKKQELVSVKQQLSVQTMRNDELREALKSGANESSEYIERTARQSLDYAKPSERVFVNISGN